MTEVPWYHRWFGEEYLELYPHRDRAEAARAVAVLMDRLQAHDQPRASSGISRRVLDLACGAGRHLEALRKHGLCPVGLDLSAPLLAEARALSPDVLLLRGDMRKLPFATDAFHVITSFFTSFGYFETEREDRQVMREIRRVVEPGGFLFLDFLNAPRVREHLDPRDERQIGSTRVIQQRRLLEGGRRVEKRIRIVRAEGEEAFTERVRLYDAPELTRMCEEEGVEPLELMGDYEGSPYNDRSPRTIIFGRARSRSPE